VAAHLLQVEVVLSREVRLEVADGRADPEDRAECVRIAACQEGAKPGEVALGR